MTDDLKDLQSALEDTIQDSAGPNVNFDPPKKRGRKKGSTSKSKEPKTEQPEQEFTQVLKAEDLTPTLILLDGWISDKLEVTAADPEILQKISESTVNIARKHSGEAAFAYMDEIILIVLLLTLVFSKYVEYEIVHTPEAEVVENNDVRVIGK